MGDSGSNMEPPNTPSNAAPPTNFPPPAPRHVNTGRVNVNGNVTDPEPTPTRDPGNWQRSCSHPLRDAPDWNGPLSVSGQLAHPNDPFVIISLAGGAPVFVPTNNSHQSGGAGSGGSSSPNGGPTGSGSANDRFTEGRGSNGGSGDDSSGRTNSSNSNGQSSDRNEPVIVTTPHAGGKGKQSLRPQTPPPYVTRFLRVDGLIAAHFEDDKLFGHVKKLPLFLEDVQRLGVFGLKSPGDGSKTQTAFMFVDTLLGAKTIYDRLQHAYPVTYISCEAFKAADVKIHDNIDRFSADVSFYVTLQESSRDNKFNVATISEMAKTAAARFGRILRFSIVDDSGFASNWSLKFSIEYNSVADASDAINTTNPVNGLTLPYGTAEHIMFRAIGYDPVDEDSPAGQASIVMQTPSPEQVGFRDDKNFEYSPTGRTALRKDGKTRASALVGYCRPGKMAGPSNPLVGQFARNIYQTSDPMAEYPMLGPDGRPHPAIAKPQDVVEWRITGGFDVRTTLMVRNIPPEMTGADFVDMLRRTVPNQFDFAYNRIDFQKSQSVGYAFVNFTGTDALLKFVHTWRGRLLPHNLYRQHLRPCAVSYANTQGYECLVAKFRNSSILEEAKSCRPLLFWTEESAGNHHGLIGQERPWPPVDNASKKTRSVENAKISGLYTPRARANNGTRGGRRGGHTRYDRGTTAQQHDDNQMAYANYQHGVGSPAPVYGPYSQPRFQPASMLYNWNTSQFVPQPGMPFHPMPYHLPPPPMLPPPPQGQVLRTHSNGDLGYRHPVMPAELAPVNSPTHTQTAHQDQFQPLLFPVKGQVPEYYRSV